MMAARIHRMLNDVRITSYGKLVLLTLGAAAAAVVLSLSSMTGDELSAGETQAPVVGGDFTYFPGQFVNKGTELPEHIQAF